MTMVRSIQNATNLSHGDPREHLSQIHNSLAMCSQMYQLPAMLLSLGNGVAVLCPVTSVAM